MIKQSMTLFIQTQAGTSINESNIDNAFQSNKLYQTYKNL